MNDRYLDAISGAGTEGPWVVGVRGAPALEHARQALADLRRRFATTAPTRRDARRLLIGARNEVM